jgi:large subunit ribosomal protein L4
LNHRTTTDGRTIPNAVRHLSSSPLPDPRIPQPKKYALPSNLVFDPRSHFLNMFDKDVPNDKTNVKPNSSVLQEVEDDNNEDGYYDDDIDDDDEDDDGELFDDEDALIFPYREGVVYTKPLPERLHVEIHTLFRSPSLVGSIHLNESVFGLDPIRVDLLKRSVDYYRAKKRGRRNAKTKTIGEVSGSGKKIRNQKGGGVARAGHSRPPQFRGGAKAHGPKNNTDYGNVKLNKKVRKLAVRHVFSQKLKEGNLILLNHLHELPTHKTNDLSRLLTPWKIGGHDGASALLLDHYYNKSDNSSISTETNDSMPTSHAGVPTNLHVAASNIPGLRVSNSYGANVYDILKCEKLIITLAALEQIEARLKKY